MANALAGKVAGLQIKQNGTGVGGSSRIVIRGNNSITGNNQPLIVVDGVPIDNFSGGTDDYWVTVTWIKVPVSLISPRMISRVCP